LFAILNQIKENDQKIIEKTRAVYCLPFIKAEKS